MRTIVKAGAQVVAVFSLLGSAAAGAAPARAAAPTAPNAWVMLAALQGAPGQAQPAKVPPPPPRAPRVVPGELLPIGLWFGLIAVALTVSDPGGRSNSPP